MQLSRRIANISPSPTVALNAKAKALAAEGKAILNFSVGEPDFPTPQPIVDQAIRSLEAGRTKYGEAGGGIEIRQAIQAKLKRDNQLDFDLNEIVVGIGAKEILFHLSLATLNDGDNVLLPAPYWVSYSSHAEAAGADYIPVPMPDNSTSRISIDELEKRSTPSTRMIILNSPNNPAGYVLNESELTELGEYLIQKDWWIVSDEIYEYMTFDSTHVSLLNLFPQLRDRFILINGLSKGSAMTGWRVGYCCAPAPVAKLVRNLQSQSSTCLPGFIEDAAVFALHAGKSLLEPSMALLKERRDIAAELLSSIDGVSFGRPEGAFYIFIDIRQVLASSNKFGDLDSLAFSQHLLDHHHLAMVPGEAFGAPGFIRLSYATSVDDLKAGIKRLHKAIEEM